MRVGRLPDGTNSQPILVLNRPPTASFTVGPAAPVARELVTLTSSAVDLDGPIVPQQWDLDGDGAYDDATGEKALYFWRRAGTYQVGLRVTDRNGAVAISRTAVVVDRRSSSSPLRESASSESQRRTGHTWTC